MKAYYFGLATLFLSWSVHAQPATPADIPLETFAAPANFSGVEISPDGTHLAYRVTVKNRSMIIVHPMGDTSKPTIIPPFGDADIRWFRWANDDIIAVSFNYSTDRSHINGLTLLDGRNSEETRFFGYKKDGSNIRQPIQLALPAQIDVVGTRFKQYGSEPFIQDRVVHWLPDDPKHILLAVDDDFDGNPEVRRVNVASGKYYHLVKGVEDIDVWIADPDGNVRFGYELSSQKPKAIYKPSDGSFTNISSADWFRLGIRPVAFDIDEPHLAYAVGKADENHDTESVMKLNMTTGEIVEVLHYNPGYDSVPLVESATRQFIGYGTLVDKVFTNSVYRKLYASLDKTFQGSRTLIMSNSPDWRKILFRVSSDVESGALYFWDRASGEVSIVGTAYPDLNPDLMSEMKAIRYQARDGLEIQAFLTTPRGIEANNLPLVIMPHGGPFALESWGFNIMTQMMASRGFAVLQPNFRGSIMQGSAFHDAGKKQWGGKMQDDLSDGVQHLVETGLADPDRVCIVGWSYGGYAALMGAIQTPEMYQCAVSINGVSSLQRLARRYNADPDYRRFVREYVGLEGAKLKDVSPVSLAEKAGVPILLVHAEDDHRVPIEHADTMANRLDELNKPYKYERIEWGGGHSLTDGRARLKMMAALEQFLAKHLGPGKVATTSAVQAQKGGSD